MSLSKGLKKLNPYIPFIILSVVIVALLAIFGIVTYNNIQRQQAEYIRTTTIKGELLIRSVEAGARFGMKMNTWGNLRLQQLLIETGQQPDIEYIFIVNDDGQIIAHSDYDLVGKRYETELDLKSIIDTRQIFYRVDAMDEENEVFEVYRQFHPGNRGRGAPGGRRMDNDFFKPLMESPFFKDLLAEPSSVIFVGFNINADREAQNAAAFNAIFSGVLLFFVTAVGLVLLFVYQHYRSTKSSLTRIQAFSDQLVDNMPVGLIAFDEQRRLTSLNSTAEQILGIDEEAALGKVAQEVLPVDIWNWWKNGDFHDESLEGEIEFQKSPDEIIPIEISRSQFLSGTGERYGSIILIKDLTEIQSLRKEIARSQRMASLGRLAAGVAHEIRNPLSSIKGFATYFKNRYADVEKDVDIADIMIQETERLNRSVGQLLEIARPVTIQPMSCDTRRLLEDSLKMVEAKASEYGIETSFDVTDDAVEVTIDRDRISQVLLNLYLNAVEAMENGGSLSVSVRTDDVSGMSVFEIRDTGTGIAADDVAKIYDPYFTTKNTGTGLGLAVVHNIVEAHGGRIEVTSQIQEGTVFTLYLPDISSITQQS